MNKTLDEPIHYDILVILNQLAIFSHLSQKELEIIKSHTSIINLEKNENLIDYLKDMHGKMVIILSGMMMSGSSIGTMPNKKLKEYTAGEIINLMSFFKKKTKVPDAFAVETTTILIINIEEFKQDPHFKKMHLKLSKKIIKYLTDRLKYTEIILNKTANLATLTIQQRLEDIKLRVTYGIFLVQTIILMCFYIYGLEIMDFFHITNIFIVSAIILFIISIFLLSFMHQSGLPLKAFGLTTKNWRNSLKEGLLCTFVLIIIVLLFKYFIIKFLIPSKNIPLFDVQFDVDKIFSTQSRIILYSMIVYTLFVPLQEFVVRGGLQTSIYRFLTGSNQQRNKIAILISNFLFMTFHLHISFLFAMASFLPGLIWGWLFSRNRTLIGPTISHMIFGIVSIFIINIERLFTNLLF